MPYFSGGFVATAIRTVKSAVYEAAIAVINFTVNIGTTALSALIYVNTNLPKYITDFQAAVPDLTPIPLASSTITYQQILQAIATGAPVVVTVGAGIALILDFIKDTNHLDATIGKLLDRPTPHGGYYEFSDEVSELSSFVKRAWPWVTPMLAGALGAWWLGYSSTEFNQVLASCSLATLTAISGIVVVGYSVNEISTYRARQRLRRSNGTTDTAQHTTVITMAHLPPHAGYYPNFPYGTSPYAGPQQGAAYYNPTGHFASPADLPPPPPSGRLQQPVTYPVVSAQPEGVHPYTSPHRIA